MDEASVKPRAQIGIFPLFSEKAASLSMIKITHAIVKMHGISQPNSGYSLH